MKAIRMMVRAALAVLSIGGGAAVARGDQPAPLAPNAEFTEGDQAPAGWSLSGGQGRWFDRNLLEVTGTGKDANHWSCSVLLDGGALYRFSMRARQTEGSGCVVSGPETVNHDWRLSNRWEEKEFVFRMPDGPGATRLRLGQWEARGTVQFDAVSLTPVLPVHASFGGLVLGEGEMLRGGRYQFCALLGGAATNYHRTLQRATAHFNTDRWCFGPGSEALYRFALPGATLRPVAAAVDVNYHTRGACVVEISTDGTTWSTLGALDRPGTLDLTEAAKNLAPAATFWLRLRAGDGPANFQVNRIEFAAGAEFADPARAPGDVAGATWFAEVTRSSAALVADAIFYEPIGPDGAPALVLTARRVGDGESEAELHAAAVDAKLDSHPLGAARARLNAGRPASFRVPLSRRVPSDEGVTLRLQAGDAEPLDLFVALRTHEYHRADYGARIAGTEGSSAVVWWCDATRKVSRRRAAPETVAPAAQLSAARNDREAVQIVVRAERGLKGLRASAGALVGRGGAILPVDNVRIFRVFYHFVHTPTDASGARDDWPDALPPLGEPIDVAAGSNQPLWVLVHVPAEAAPGDYEGEIRLEAEGFSARVPLKLHVWDFALPERNQLETAIGLDHWTLFDYHRVKTDEDKRRVLAMYFESFAEHRISPYDPAPLDPIRVRFLPEADPPRAELDSAAFEAAAADAFERYRFTSFMLHLEGMGGGTFHHRVDPRIGSFGEDTPQYQAIMADYLGKLETRLRQRGWLDMAYVYWFDEPDPKDYEFVRRGMERIKRSAPGLRTMLTEQPEDALAGPIDIWCPVSFNYDHEASRSRRAAGERFWWYICCGPKAPYCTLFIDHPATELRVWLWQTWQRDIRGVLVWSANYWNSTTAFPDPAARQNPYDDPMGYVSGYGVPPGAKQHWGNGDGRFIYPPIEAAGPNRPGDRPILKPPVSSIRWEMLREGVEDYEMLWLLRERIEQRRDRLSAERLAEDERLLAVPPEITTDMTTFTTEPAPIYARRAEIARAIEQLGQEARP